MGAPSERHLEAARERARNARLRADLARLRAARFEQLSESGPLPLRALHAELAVSHRRTAEAHAASARMQASYVARLEASVAARTDRLAPPALLGAVADVVGALSVGLVLWDREGVVTAVVGSDRQARTSVDVELMVREGPAHAAGRDRAVVVASRAEIETRWPEFARATAPVDLGLVAAAPLRCGSAATGALTVFDPPWRSGHRQVHQLQTAADALLESLLPDARPGWPTDDDVVQRFLDDDRVAALQQAVGIVAIQARCRTADARALLVARAFADGADVSEVAARIVAGDLRLVD